MAQVPELFKGFPSKAIYDALKWIVFHPVDSLGVALTIITPIWALIMEAPVYLIPVYTLAAMGFYFCLCAAKLVIADLMKKKKKGDVKEANVDLVVPISSPEPHFTIDNIKKEFIWKDDDTLTMTVTGTVSASPPLCLGDIHIELNGQGRFREWIQGDWWVHDRFIFNGEIPFTVDIPSYFTDGIYWANLLCKDRNSQEERPSNIFRVDIPLRPAKG